MWLTPSEWSVHGLDEDLPCLDHIVVRLLFSRTHMSRFWNPETQIQVPMVERFNEAIRGSEAVVRLLGVMFWTWVEAGVVWWLVGDGDGGGGGGYGDVGERWWAEGLFVVGFGVVWVGIMGMGRGR